MRYQADHKQKTRQTLLKETAKALRREGPHQLGVARVMAKAGLTHGGFYAHFKSKDDLIAAGIEQLFEETRVRAPATEGQTPAEALAAYIEFYLSPAHRDARATGCPLPFLAGDAPRLGPEPREGFARGVARLRALLADRLGAMGHSDAEAEASSMLAELVGAVSLARAEPDIAASDRLLDHSRQNLMRRIGLEPQP